MSGRIIPAPLAIPVTVASLAPICARRDRALGTVSVVMIASAARAQLSSRRAAREAGRRATSRSTGSGSMITPVENGRTWRGSHPISVAASSQLALAPAIPVFPVPALALPVLTSRARGALPEARCSFATCTGAAQKRFCVNTPETRAPSASDIRSRSLRPDFLMPDSAMPSLTPFTGSRSPGRGGLKLTAIRLGAGSLLAQLAVTVLVFFPRPARAGIVAADLAYLPDERRRLKRRRGVRPCSGEGFFVPGVLVLHVLDRRGHAFHLLDLLRLTKLGHHQRARHFQLDRLHEIAEQLEGLALVFLLRVFLRVTAQMDSLAQMVERGEVLKPVVVERREQYEPLDLMYGLRRIGCHFAGIGRLGLADRALEERVVVQPRIALEPLRQRQVEPELGSVHFFKARYVPLLLHALFGDIGTEEIGHHPLAQRRDLVRDVLRFEDGIPQLIDFATLIVCYVVVFQQLLADIEVVRLDLALRALDRSGDQTVLDRLALGHPQALHDGVDPLSGKDPQQGVLERQVKARGTRIALAAGAAAQLVVDSPGFVPLGPDDVQAARGDDPVVQVLPLTTQLADAALLLGGVEIVLVPHEIDLLLDVAAEHDVRAPACHVGRDGDHLRTPGLGDDLRLARVLLCVQDLVRQLVLLQHCRDELGILYRSRADQHRLAALVAVLDVADDCLVLFRCGAKDLVVAVGAYHRHVRRDDDDLQPVDLLEFVGLGIGRSRHPRELAVHAEVILERDRRERLVLTLDRHVLLGLA